METWLDISEKIAVIATSIFAGAALNAYRYQKKRDRLIDATNLLSFFREKILKEHTDLLNYVWDNVDPEYMHERMRIDTRDLKKFRDKNYAKSFKQITLVKNRAVKSKQENLLNMLEEFSVKIKPLGILKDKNSLKILDAIKQPFVDIVEQNATSILFHRDVLSGKNTFLGLLDLYDEWKDSVERKTPQERIEEFKMKDEDRLNKFSQSPTE